MKRRTVLTLFAVSLSIRLGWLSFAQVTPLSDSAYYHGLAKSLASTGIYEFGGLQAWVPPGYPLFLAGVFRLFGDSLLAMGFVQAVLGAISSLLAALLAGRLFTARVAVWAGAMHAVSPVMVVYVPAAATENLAIPLFLGMLLAVHIAGETQGRRSHAIAVVGGLIGGTMLLTRSAMLFVIPACALLLLYNPRLRRWSAARPVLFVAAVILVLVPWAVRNHRVGLGWIAFSTSGGAGLYRANYDTCRNGEWSEPPQDFVQGLTEAERAGAYSRAAHRWIRENPRCYLTLCRVRLGRLLGAEADPGVVRLLTPTRENDRAIVAEFQSAWHGKSAPADVIERARSVIARNTRYLYWLNVAFWSPLGLLSLILAIFCWRKTAILLLPVLFYAGGLILTIVSPRYRVMSDPLLYILIAALLCDVLWGTTELGGRLRRPARVTLILLAISGSLITHATGRADSWYWASSMKIPDRGLPGAEFSPADLSRASSGWVYRTRTHLSPAAGGLECVVSGTEDTSAPQYGGLSVPLGPAAAVRMELTIPEPQHVVNVFVDLADRNNNRVSRWVWTVNGSISRADRHGTYVFVPGRPVAFFLPEVGPDVGPAARLHLFLEIAPRQKASFVLHRLEFVPLPATSRPAPAGPAGEAQRWSRRQSS